ncbi:response regulator transcription factor [Oribacterium sp. WCC10]|uniref:response regulator transcription factor n=1 Tax=Oribacterium sp. WCC10 TaxID=1855343 RepID=UPI0008ED9547|nr:response regulator [Oribacterium sp. WCC10]SFG63846.1 two-component system, response regulator YesN [Oribacterium sp. WCC10]
MIKVMIVDDERFVRRGIIQETDWELIGCEVVAEAGNGLEALEKARETRPDLVVSDIRMPEMDGLQLGEKLVELYPEIKLIYLTAYSDFEYARKALRVGASDYLLKPFEDGELEATIQRLIHLGFPEEQEKEPDILGLKDKSEVNNKYVKEAIEYIEKHYMDTEFTLMALAESLSVSEGHISRLFKAETANSINNYLTKYRIKKAMELLKDVKIKVYEVAELVGYQDIAYFSNTFKKLIGKSPSDYQMKGL